MGFSLKIAFFFLKILIATILFFPASVFSENLVFDIPVDLNEKEQHWLDQKHTVRVRVGSWPPFMIVEDGTYGGISIEYLEAIFKLHGIKYRYIPYTQLSWSQALTLIRVHEVVDLLPTAKITDERKKYIAFTENYLNLPWVIFTRDDAGFVSSVADLKGKTVAVPKGYVMQGLLEKEFPEIKLKLIDQGEVVHKCMEMLASGMADAFIGNLTVGTYIIKNYGFNNIKVAAPTPFGTHDQAMAVRDDWPELASIINKTLKQVSYHQKSQIQNKWLSVQYEHGVQVLDILKWVAGVSSFLFLIIGFFMVWNRRLKTEIIAREKAESESKRNEAKFRTLSEAAFEGIVITREGRVIDLNSSIPSMFGYIPEEMIGKTAIDFIADEEADKILEILKNQSTSTYETTGKRKDGSTFPVEVQVKILDSNGERLRVAAIRDITERKRTEEEIRSLKGILPFCSYCKNIRDDEGYWQKIDVYIKENSDADISHGICPDCLKQNYPDLVKGEGENISQGKQR